MMKRLEKISLQHVFINQTRCIGLLPPPNESIRQIMHSLPEIKWCDHNKIHYVKNTKHMLNLIFDSFKAKAWVDCRNFFQNRKPSQGQRRIAYKKEEMPAKAMEIVPKEYLDKLKIKRYSINTIRSYTSSFEQFMRFYKGKDLLHLNDEDIRHYLRTLVEKGVSNSSVNIAINAIKFYYEIVLNMPGRYYHIERPRKQKTLPYLESN